jgi:hypothetical protein
MKTKSLLTNRREFVKKSLLVCASATLAAENARAKTAQAPPPPPSRSAAGVGPNRKPYPLIPYGSGDPIYLADLDQCEPSSALAKIWTPKHWRLTDFVSDHAKGVMLAAGQVTGVPDLTYRLKQKGWFAIYFGLLSKYSESRLLVRLQREPVFSLLTPNDMAETQTDWVDIQFGRHSYRSDGIEELFWKYDRLSGADDAIVMRQLKVQLLQGDPDAHGNCFIPCWLGYIKLVPLSEYEVRALEADRRRRDTRRLFATDDANSIAGFYTTRSANDIRRQLEPYRNTDFSRMYWEAGMGDLTYYPSKIGTLFTLAWKKDFDQECDRLMGETYAGFQARGIDPFRVALDYCHEIGLEFHASYRVAGFQFPPPEDEWNLGGFYDRHPEWRCMDRHGRQTPRMSYAFPGVRQFVLSLFREIVSYPVDGVCVLYNRRLPVLGYEEPLVAGFKAKYGIDPRVVAETDPRWQADGAAVLTDFMRELRGLMRAEERRQSRRPIGITAVVMGSREENYGYGLDLEAWVKEGLIDTLVPYASVVGGSSFERSWEDPKAAEFFIRLTKGTACTLALNLMPRNVPPEEYKRRAHALYEAGVDHLYFWDTYIRANYDPSWSTLCRLGHKEELAEWVSRGSPPVLRPRNPVLRLGGWDLSYRTPG